MEAPAGDGKQSNSDLPSPGWYADPSGDGGVRWWTGSEWASAGVIVSQTPQDSAAERLPAASLWLADSVRVCRKVFSELFALITVLLLPAFLLLAGAAWYAFREAAMLVSVDQDTGSMTLEETRGGAELAQASGLVLGALGLVWVGGSILAMASSIQAVQSHAKRPATWLQTLATLSRRPKKMTIAISTFVVYSSIVGFIWFSGGLVTFLLLLPSIVIGFFVWVRYSFVAAASALGPDRPSAFRQSSSAVSGRFLLIARRYAYLGAWTVLSAIGFLLIVRLVASGVAIDPAQPGTRGQFVFTVTGAFGNNVYMWFLVAMLSAFYWGLVVSTWSGATALLFADLDGDIKIEQYALREADAE